jgi:hypothetical protein
MTSSHPQIITSTHPSNTMEPKQYTLSDIKTLRERQQTAHRGRSIYSNMRSISEDAFRNALENDALPIIEQLLGVVQKQHEALLLCPGALLYAEKYVAEEQVQQALRLGKSWIEQDKHQRCLNTRRKEDEQRSR